MAEAEAEADVGAFQAFLSLQLAPGRHKLSLGPRTLVIRCPRDGPGRPELAVFSLQEAASLARRSNPMLFATVD